MLLQLTFSCIYLTCGQMCIWVYHTYRRCAQYASYKYSKITIVICYFEHNCSTVDSIAHPLVKSKHLIFLFICFISSISCSRSHSPCIHLTHLPEAQNTRKRTAWRWFQLSPTSVWSHNAQNRMHYWQGYFVHQQCPWTICMLVY